VICAYGNQDEHRVVRRMDRMENRCLMDTCSLVDFVLKATDTA
jgi:hypothetical protein